MTTTFPLRFRPFQKDLLFTNDSGQAFVSSERFLKRFARKQLTEDDLIFLKDHGHAFEKENDLPYLNHLRGIATRVAFKKPLSYIILVPTLRCDLSCDYCQVSRVQVTRKGFDWTEETLNLTLQFLSTLETDSVKIEFQGGEPFLRPDIISKVIEFCERHFQEAEFVICTNLSTLTDKIHQIISKSNVYVSTSLDGGYETHKQNRTETTGQTDQFLSNIKNVIDQYGPDKVSALPTIDYHNPPPPNVLVESYLSHGIRSIFLRPVNYVGFARKAFKYSRKDVTSWVKYHRSFLDYIVEHNMKNPDDIVEEYYFSLCLRRVMQAGQDSHVDLRSPNYMGKDYLVIDFDGRIYPTDEARMITRTGQIDLCIGTIEDGLNQDKIETLNSGSINNFEPECLHCVYQPFCGKDVIDDLSRDGRIDAPKHTTYFCKTHMAMFDQAFEFIYSDDEAVRTSVSHWLGLPSTHNGLGVMHDIP